MQWIVLIVRLPSEPSRHRVAVWRELRRGGAVQLGQGTWALPDTPLFAECGERVTDLASRGEGEILVLRAEDADKPTGARLEAIYTESREAEWAEFVSECGKYLAELRHEADIEKFTLAELDEEEQSLERLRRWHRELSLRDVFGAPSKPEAGSQLHACEASLEQYADRVFRTLNRE